MESISIHGSRSIQVKKSKRNARCEYPDILCDRARKASPSCRKFCVLCSKLTSTPCIFLTAFTVTVALVRKARNEFGRNFWHSFKSTNYHCITNIQETPDLSRQFLANYVFYRIEFSFIQIMNSFFRAARKREKCARIYLRRTAQTTTVCAKCVPCVALGVTTGKREYQILEIQIFL